jgi:hypothetical protein
MRSKDSFIEKIEEHIDKEKNQEIKNILRFLKKVKEIGFEEEPNYKELQDLFTYQDPLID